MAKANPIPASVPATADPAPVAAVPNPTSVAPPTPTEKPGAAIRRMGEAVVSTKSPGGIERIIERARVLSEIGAFIATNAGALSMRSTPTDADRAAGRSAGPMLQSYLVAGGAINANAPAKADYNASYPK